MGIYILATLLKTAAFVAIAEGAIRLAARSKTRLEAGAAPADDRRSRWMTAAVWTGAMLAGGLMWLQTELFSHLAASARVSPIWNLAPIATAGAFLIARKWSTLTGEETEPATADAIHVDGPENEIFDKAA